MSVSLRAPTIAATIVLLASSTSAEVISPHFWIGDWRGELTTSFEGKCPEVGARPRPTKKKVRFALSPDENRRLVVYAGGGELPTSLAEGQNDAFTNGSGNLVLALAYSDTAVLQRQGLSLLYWARHPVPDTPCHVVERGTLKRRVSSGIEACDHQLAIHLAANKCRKFPADKLPNFPDFEAVQKMRGQARATQKQSCADAVAATVARMQDAGCMP